MKKKIVLFIIALAFTLCKQKTEEINVKKTSTDISIQEFNENAPENVKKALTTFDNFFDTLRGKLINSIKEKGLSGSISECKILSPEMEGTFSKEHNMKIYRISDKYRNPDHKPTPDEMKVLEYWMTKLNNKEEIKPVYYQFENKTKVMKPIKIIAEMCLNCHGDLNTMDKDLKEALKKEYPNDMAYGYKLNDLRGAFVAEF